MPSLAHGTRRLPHQPLHAGCGAGCCQVRPSSCRCASTPRRARPPARAWTRAHRSPRSRHSKLALKLERQSQYLCSEAYAPARRAALLRVLDGIPVPGLAAGAHLWLSGIGQLSGTTFTSHLGDLPNLEVNVDGTATKMLVAARLRLADVANRAMMIHASQDDNSGRMACGRIEERANHPCGRSTVHQWGQRLRNRASLGADV